VRRLQPEPAGAAGAASCLSRVADRMALMTLIGLYDDLRATRPAIRFVLQGGWS